MAERQGQRASEREATAPAPDDPAKPDEVSDIEKPSWKYILRKTLREFIADHCIDLAAALTFFATLAIFPTLLAFVSLLGLFADAEQTTDDLIGFIDELVPQQVLEPLRGIIENLANSPSAGLAFLLGLAGALWSASGYVTGFSRAMNRIYGIQEGRPFWKLRPIMLVITVLAIIAAVAAAGLLVVSGPIAEAVASAFGIGEVGLAVWDVAKWPIIAALAVTVVAVLFYTTPNVQQPKFRWLSVGAALALGTWVVASLGFGFYVSNFANYNETYGSIGGIIVFLLWAWISNLALLFGAELDAELERGRELQAGIEAEEHLQLPPRDTTASDKAAEQHTKDIELGRRLRERFGNTPPPPASDADDDDHDDDRGAREKALRKATRRLTLKNATQATKHALKDSGR